MNPIVLDLETAPLARSLELPYPAEDRSPPSNYKSAEAIAGWHARDEEKWRAELAGRCSVSPRLGRIVAASVASLDDGLEPHSLLAASEDDERSVLSWLWAELEEARGYVVTFNGRFDLRFIVQRSLALGVTPTLPSEVIRRWFRKYTYAPHYDCRAVLTEFDDRADGTLSDWCGWLGIPCDGAGIKGSEVFERYQAGDYDTIAAHSRSDVSATAQLYARISAMYGGIECAR